MELVLDFPLASIKSDEHLAEAQRVMDGLLAGKKPFSRKMIHALANYFHVDVGVLAANI